MSAAAAWDSVPAQVPLGVPARRPSLVLVDGGVAEGGRRVRPQRAARSAGIGIPRWMRLAMTLSVLGVGAVLLLGVGGVGLAAGSADPVSHGSVEVRPGQTLSEIARAELPGLPTGEAVARIQLANNLPSSQVTAGQVIVIPGH